MWSFTHFQIPVVFMLRPSLQLVYPQLGKKIFTQAFQDAID